MSYLKGIKPLSSVEQEPIDEDFKQTVSLVTDVMEESVKSVVGGTAYYIAGAFDTYCRFKNIKVIDITVIEELSILGTLTLDEYISKYPDKQVYYEFFKWFTTQE